MDSVGAVVIGGGAVGCATAWELARHGLRDLFVLERMPGVGEVQSGRNSGVVHAGIYYRPGSLKAALCTPANAHMYEFCQAHGVPIASVGKLVVARSRTEVAALEALAMRAKANGVPGVRLLTRAGASAIEPNVDVPAALHVPTTGIVDAARYTRTLANLAEAEGARVVTGFEVTGIEAGGGSFRVTGVRGGREETVEAEVVVNAAGLNCDRVARMVAPGLEAEVVPLRGEYARFNRRRRPPLWLNGANVYPVPEPIEVDGEPMQMVGVHLTPTFALTRGGDVVVGDVVTVGPDFGHVARRDDYETARKPLDLFFDRARRYFPGLEPDDLELDTTGIMVHVRGQDDFVVRRDGHHPDCIQLIGIDSPGLTCSLGVAGRVRELLTGS